MKPNFYNPKIIEKKEKGDRFLIKTDLSLDFLPGQFMNFIYEKNNKKIIRQYSIASLPNEKLEFYIKKIKNGIMSNYLFNKKINDKIKIFGPLGNFTLKNTKKDIIFIGIGTGIAPLRSMIKYLIYKKNSNSNIILFYGNRKEEDLFFHNEFLEITKEYTNFSYYPIISQPKNWKGLSGYIQDHLYLISNFSKYDYYICASKQIIETINKILILNKVPKESIFYEMFFKK